MTRILYGETFFADLMHLQTTVDQGGGMIRRKLMANCAPGKNIMSQREDPHFWVAQMASTCSPITNVSLCIGLI